MNRQCAYVQAIFQQSITLLCNANRPVSLYLMRCSFKCLAIKEIEFDEILDFFPKICRRGLQETFLTPNSRLSLNGA
jgi:hypothetical protein